MLVEDQTTKLHCHQDCRLFSWISVHLVDETGFLAFDKLSSDVIQEIIEKPVGGPRPCAQCPCEIAENGFKKLIGGGDSSRLAIAPGSHCLPLGLSYHPYHVLITGTVQILFRPEVVEDKSWRHSSVGGDGADGGPGEALFGEPLDRDIADPSLRGAVFVIN